MTTTVDGNSGGTAVTTTTQPTLQGQVLQVVRYQTGAVATGTTQIPTDDTIPQSGEGDQYMSLAITPRSATSKLVINIVWQGSSNNGPASATAALFQDSTANALAGLTITHAGTNYWFEIVFDHSMTSGTTSSTTFKVRVGPNSAQTLTFNGLGGARTLGGVMASSITITEVVP